MYKENTPRPSGTPLKIGSLIDGIARSEVTWQSQLVYGRRPRLLMKNWHTGTCAGHDSNYFFAG